MTQFSAPASASRPLHLGVNAVIAVALIGAGILMLTLNRSTQIQGVQLNMLGTVSFFATALVLFWS